MELDIIQKAGLTESQAKTYLALVVHGASSPAQLATITGETRTNTYQVVDKLVALELAKKLEDGKTSKYVAGHPSNLELIAEKRRKLMAKNEQLLKTNISGLIDLFYVHNEMPGSKTLTGADGIREVHSDILRTGQDLYLLGNRSYMGDLAAMGAEYREKFRQAKAKKGINTYGITEFTQFSKRHIDEKVDEKILYHRITMPNGFCDFPVEVNVYGSKCGLILFGETQMSIIIDSAPVAAMMKWMLTMIGVFVTDNYPQFSDSSSWARDQAGQIPSRQKPHSGLRRND